MELGEPGRYERSRDLQPIFDYLFIKTAIARAEQNEDAGSGIKSGLFGIEKSRTWQKDY